MPKPIVDNICDELRFNAIFKKYAKDLNNFLFYKFGDELDPKDKVQDAFIKLWQNCKTVSPDKAKSYLFTVANNMMLNAVAHQKVVFKYKKTEFRSYTNESPEFIMEEQEYHEKLKSALANLTEAQRTAFMMNRVEGKKFKEIAVLLDISTKAVEKRIYGALKKLREEIDEL